MERKGTIPSYIKNNNVNIGYDALQNPGRLQKRVRILHKKIFLLEKL